MRKGIFIPDITVEMFRNASLEAVEELLVSGTMEDIEITDRPHGEWICEGAMADYTNKLIYMCSICGCHFSKFKEDINVYNFCPNCGASMRKEGDAE